MGGTGALSPRPQAHSMGPPLTRGLTIQGAEGKEARATTIRAVACGWDTTREKM